MVLGRLSGHVVVAGRMRRLHPGAVEEEVQQVRGQAQQEMAPSSTRLYGSDDEFGPGLAEGFIGETAYGIGDGQEYHGSDGAHKTAQPTTRAGDDAHPVWPHQ